MKQTLALLSIVIGIILSGCTRYGIYQHPMLINSTPYATIPLKKDSSKSALYVGGSIFGGFTNDEAEDGIGALQGTIHQGFSFGSFQAHYGLNGTIGTYRASDYGDVNNSLYSYNANLNNFFIDSINGTKFFGSVGFSGGINAVIPFNDGGEWRIIGLEFTHQYEFDNSYNAFRRKISLQDANVVEHTRHYSTLGLSTELVLNLEKNESLGFKFQSGAALGNPRFYESYSANYKTFRTYFSGTCSFQSKKSVFYLQTNIGYYSLGGLIGFHYRIR